MLISDTTALIREAKARSGVTWAEVATRLGKRSRGNMAKQAYTSQVITPSFVSILDAMGYDIAITLKRKRGKTSEKKGE